MVVGSIREKTQVAVIGAGPGGYVAALRAADLGKEVALVELRERPGGVCLIEGCIPSKTLIHAVEVAEAAREAAAFGVKFTGVSIDPAALRKHTASVVDGLTGGVRALLKARGVEIVHGRASFVGPNSIKISGDENSSPEVSAIDFDQCVIATGSRPVVPTFAEGLTVWQAADALAIPKVPKTLLVVGGGYIGLELGFVYAGLGSKVTVVELTPNLLPGTEADLARVVAKSAQKTFESVLLASRVVALKKTRTGFAADIETNGKTTSRAFEQVFIAVGRRPNTEGLGLEAAGVALDERGLIAIDECCRTSAPHIFAIGDVTPGPMLAHKASRQGKVAAEVIAGLPSAYDNRAVPAVVYTDPEIATAGLTEAEAKSGGREIAVGRFPLTALGRARTMGAAEGFAKIIADKSSGLILGAGIVGPHASELIAEVALAIEMGATLEDLMATIHPHPTLSEAVMEAAEVAAGAPIHISRK